MKKYLDKVVTLSNQGVHFTKQHSPIILMAAAGAGVVGTVVLSMKAGKKLDVLENNRTEIAMDVMNEIGTGDRRDSMVLDRVNELYPRTKFAWDIAKVVAPPVLMATLTVAAATGSYTIMAKRITGLSAALAISNQERQWYKNEVRTRYGDDVFHEFEHGYEQYVDENGVGHTVDNDTRPTQTDCYVKWKGSEDYVSDDHNHNMAIIEDRIRKIEELISRKGTVLLNTVYDILGFPATAEGGILGFSDTHGPAFSVVAHDIANINHAESWTTQKEITISWTQPIYVYDNIDYKSDLM